MSAADYFSQPDLHSVQCEYRCLYLAVSLGGSPHELCREVLVRWSASPPPF